MNIIPFTSFLNKKTPSWDEMNPPMEKKSRLFLPHCYMLKTSAAVFHMIISISSSVNSISVWRSVNAFA
jgi:hypothetical protein